MRVKRDVISVDTNILLPAVETSNPVHGRAVAFLESLEGREDVALSELVLLELYVLLRNPAVLVRPRLSEASASWCRAIRRRLWMNGDGRCPTARPANCGSRGRVRR